MLDLMLRPDNPCIQKDNVHDHGETSIYTRLVQLRHG